MTKTSGLANLKMRIVNQFSAVSPLLLNILAEMLRSIECRDKPDVEKSRLSEFRFVADAGDGTIKSFDDRLWNGRWRDEGKINWCRHTGVSRRSQNGAAKLPLFR
jgi:hypothetical protein